MSVPACSTFAPPAHNQPSRGWSSCDDLNVPSIIVPERESIFKVLEHMSLRRQADCVCRCGLIQDLIRGARIFFPGWWNGGDTLKEPSKENDRSIVTDISG